MRNRVISEKINRLLLAQLTEKFPVFDGIRRFVTAFERAHSLLEFHPYPANVENMVSSE
jgi:hypothetical protein